MKRIKKLSKKAGKDKGRMEADEKAFSVIIKRARKEVLSRATPSELRVARKALRELKTKGIS